MTTTKNEIKRDLNNKIHFNPVSMLPCSVCCHFFSLSLSLSLDYIRYTLHTCYELRPATATGKDNIYFLPLYQAEWHSTFDSNITFIYHYSVCFVPHCNMHYAWSVPFRKNILCSVYPMNLLVLLGGACSFHWKNMKVETFYHLLRSSKSYAQSLLQILLLLLHRRIMVTR